MKECCKILEADNMRLQSRGSYVAEKEPSSTIKSVRFSDRVHSLSNHDIDYESDYSKYEGNYFWNYKDYKETHQSERRAPNLLTIILNIEAGFDLLFLDIIPIRNHLMNKCRN